MEENKLATFSTWTIMLGCNESSVVIDHSKMVSVCVVGSHFMLRGCARERESEILYTRIATYTP